MAKNTIKMEKVYMYRDGKVSFGSHWSAKGEKKRSQLLIKTTMTSNGIGEFGVTASRHV